MFQPEDLYFRFALKMETMEKLRELTKNVEKCKAPSSKAILGSRCFLFSFGLYVNRITTNEVEVLIKHVRHIWTSS